MATLESIPSEILSTIAFYLAVSPIYTKAAAVAAPPSADTRLSALAGTLDTSPSTPAHPSTSTFTPIAAPKQIPTFFPTPLVPLLATSKHIAALLAFDANPQLYARIFAEKFDTAAIRRRTSAAARLVEDDGSGAEEKDGIATGGGSEEEKMVSGSVTDSALAAELRTRCMMMKRFRMAMRSGQVSWVRPEDLFVVYLMLLENGEPLCGYIDISLVPSAAAADISFLLACERRRQKPTIPSQSHHQCTATCFLVPVPRSRSRRKGDQPGITAKHFGTNVDILDHLAAY
jgi:hypothetical protein